MCGIVGRVNFRSGAPVDPAVIEKMCALVQHRGPDGSGVFVNGSAGLGNRRLAIVDLSDAGRQPMPNSSRQLWITYNGEVYNFRELKKTLEGFGYRFRSATDTEVILAAYEHWGLDCLQQFRGMFAFAIWNDAERTLLLARDRLGEKPLYYRLDDEGIAFASEPKAFLAEPTFAARPNLRALSHYLSFQYVPSPLSAFQGVSRLAPAHYALIKDGRVEVRRYWRLQYRVKRRLSEDEAAAELVERLREAVRMRLVSDVPLGAFLSGGIDSSAIVALMAEQQSLVKTFSIGFTERSYDEVAYARLVAKRYGTEHHEFLVQRPAVEILPRLVWHYNEPYADSSAIPTYCLAELARSQVTVALNGDAGDENFAGYDRYRAAVLGSYYDRAPSLIRAVIRTVGHSLPSPSASRTLLSRSKRFIEGLGETADERYARWLMHFHPALKAEVCTPEFLTGASDVDSRDIIRDVAAQSDAPDLVDRMLDVDVNTYLPDDLLVKVDIATMAHGLEGRSPLLDHPFMEFAASLPSRLKLRGSTGKYIFKKAMSSRLPAAILKRPKMGFGVPLDAWFRGELKEMAYDVLLSRSMASRGYFRRGSVARLLDEHVTNKGHWHYQLWNLLMLELWHRTFIDAAP